MLLSRHQKASQNYNEKRGNRSFEYVAQLKYLGMTVNFEFRRKLRGD
jgi:hypothetical protein